MKFASLVLLSICSFPCIDGQPANNACADAIGFIPATNEATLVSGSTVDATVGPYLGNCAPVCTTVAPTAFYSFAGTGKKLKISTCSDDTDFATAITMAASCGTSGCFASSNSDPACSNANAAAVTFDSELGKNYILAVHGRAKGRVGDFGVSALEYIPPANNNCADAVAFVPQTNEATLVTGSTVNGTVGPYLGNCAPVRTTVAPTAFYSFAGTGSKLKISTCSDDTDFATAITVAGSCGNSGCFEASNSDTACPSNPNATAVTFDSELGKNYILAVHGRAEGREGGFGVSALEYIPPANNNCADAVAFVPQTNEATLVTGSTVNGTVGPYLGNCAPVCTTVAPTAFYSFASTGKKLKISTCSDDTDFATAITVAGLCGNSGCFEASNSDTACPSNANAAAVTFDSELGKSYILAVHGRAEGREGGFGVSALEYVPPVNNNCADGIGLGVGSSVSGTTVSATVLPYIGNVRPYTTVAPGVAYFVVGNGQEFRATTCSAETDYPSAMSVSRGGGNGCGSAVASSSNDVDCLSNGLSSTVTWQTEVGQIYNIFVHGRAATNEGNFCLQVVDTSAPAPAPSPVSRAPYPSPTPNPTKNPTPSPTNSPTPNPTPSPTVPGQTSAPTPTTTEPPTTSTPTTGSAATTTTSQSYMLIASVIWSCITIMMMM